MTTATMLRELKIDNAIALPALDRRLKGTPIHHSDLLKAVKHLWAAWANMASDLPAMVDYNTDLGDGDYVLKLRTTGMMTLEIVPADTTQCRHMNHHGQSSAFSVIVREEGDEPRVCEPQQFENYARSLVFTLATNLSPVLVRDTRERNTLRLVLENTSSTDLIEE